MNKSVRIETFCVIDAGTMPREDDMNFRPWQKECLKKLDGKKRAVIIAPTGSGKSTVAKARGAIKLSSNPELKHVVSVPQRIIASSFGPLELNVTWPGVGKLIWSSGPLDVTDTVNSLLDFITSKKKRTTSSQRIRICTHQTLIAVFKYLRRKNQLALLKNVFLTIDEIHHSSSFSFEEDDEEVLLENRLGEIVSYFFKYNLHLDMFTATWMRSNYFNIIPLKYEDNRDYTKYTLPIDEYLKGMKYLRKVRIRFLTGSPEETLQQIYREDSAAKTICYLPPVRSIIMRGYDDKYSMRKKLSSSLGSSKLSDDGMTETIKLRRRSIRILDLVTEEGREERKDYFLQSIGHNSPDLLYSLNMCKEGFDWPEASRAFVIGPRGSMIDIIQMLGRLLRDHPGKTSAEFNIILPVANKGDPEQVRDYLKIMISSLIVEWQFRRPKLCNQKEKDITDKVFIQNPDVGCKAILACLDIGMNSDDKADAIEVFRSGLDRNDIKLDPDEKDILAPILVRIFSRSLIDVDDIPFDPQLIEKVFGRIRSWTAQFGYENLTKLREALGRKVLLTEDKIWEAMQKYHEKTGEWPSCGTDGEVPGLPEYTWNQLDTSLRNGSNGLRAKLSLHRLLNLRIGKQLLTEDKIWESAQLYYAETGEWPNFSLKSDAPGLPGYNWIKINHALYKGKNGLKTKSSLAKFLKSHGVKFFSVTENDILKAARKYYKENGKWPSCAIKEEVSDTLGVSWNKIDRFLRYGQNGLKPRSSLSKFLSIHGAINRSNKTPLTENDILKAARKYYKENGEWPYQMTKGEVFGFPGHTWRSIDGALYHGRFGLKGGSSLFQLLVSNKLKVDRSGRSRKVLLTEDKIWEAMQKYHEKTGEWPSCGTDGEVPGLPEYTWNQLDTSLRNGRFGLKGGSSLFQLNPDTLKTNRIPLTINKIIKAITIYYKNMGELPSKNTDGKVPGLPGDSWKSINRALYRGCRGIEQKSSLAKILDGYFPEERTKDLAA